MCVCSKQHDAGAKGEKAGCYTYGGGKGQCTNVDISTATKFATICRNNPWNRAGVCQDSAQGEFLGEDVTDSYVRWALDKTPTNYFSILGGAYTKLPDTAPSWHKTFVIKFKKVRGVQNLLWIKRL